MTLEFDLVDVFTGRPFAGNQLAVVHGGDSLSREQCLAIAREFGFSETTFPSSEVADEREYATRIFTPGAEIPFAGHPTLGTAWALRERGLLSGADAVQTCGAGKIGVRFLEGGLVELSARPRDLFGPLDEGLAAALLGDVGLSAADLAGSAYAAGCGLTFVHLPVAEEALPRAAPSGVPLRRYAAQLAAAGPARDPVEGINVFAVAESDDREHVTVRSRVFVPGLSVPEDPATGAAAAGLGVALVASGRLPAGGRYEITQGVEMGRPSRLHGRVEAVVDGGAAVAVLCHVAGMVQLIANGRIAVPAPG